MIFYFISEEIFFINLLINKASSSDKILSFSNPLLISDLTFSLIISAVSLSKFDSLFKKSNLSDKKKYYKKH